MKTSAARAPIPLDDVPLPPHADHWKIFTYAHTHWDREWYRTFERFRMQLVGMVDHVIATLDADPDFTTFVMDGQAIVLEDYLVIRPQRLPKLQQLIADGRLEIGPWYILPDEFLVSGESLVRNLLEGRRVCRSYGHELPVGYLPDPFGHVAQLPQILAGFGIDNVIFSRGMGDEFHEYGSEFLWRAPNGSEVIAIVQRSPYTNGYCNAELFGRDKGVDADDGWQAARELIPFLAETSQTGVLVLAAGCDHELVDAGLSRVEAGLDQITPGAQVQLAGLGPMVDAVREAVQVRESAGAPLSRHRGELRGSLHAPILASILSARVEIKQENYICQSLLERYVEPMAVNAAMCGAVSIEHMKPFLRHAWRMTLKNQPHDSIGGCSVDDVHDEMRARTQRVINVCGGILEDIRIATGTEQIAVVLDPAGAGGITQRENGEWVSIKSGIGHGFVPLDRAISVGSDDGASVDGECAIVNKHLHVAVTDGRVDVTLRGSGLLIEGAFSFVDEPDQGDEYDFGAVVGAQRNYGSLVSAEAVQIADGIAQLTVVHDVAGDEITTHLRLGPDTRHIDATTEWDNTRTDHRLRIRTASIDAADYSVADGHFGIVKRPVVPRGSGKGWAQQPVGIGCLESFVALPAAAPEASSANSGLAGIALFGRGLHEYEVMGEGGEGSTRAALELTIVRSVGWLSRDDIAGRPGHAGPALATPEAQCQGERSVEWALRPLADGEVDDLAVESNRWHAPPQVFEPLHHDLIPQSGHMARTRDVRNCGAFDKREQAAAAMAASGIDVTGDGVVVSAVKFAENDDISAVVRLIAPGRGEAVVAQVVVGWPLASAHRVRLDETVVGAIEFDRSAPSLSLTIEPGEIITLRLVPVTSA